MSNINSIVINMVLEIPLRERKFQPDEILKTNRQCWKIALKRQTTQFS